MIKGGQPGSDGGSQLASLRYDIAVKEIDSQVSALSELRSRTGLLISAGSISTSFLGSSAAKGHPGFPVKFLWAIIPFGSSIFLALLILLPILTWRFTLRSGNFEKFAGMEVAVVRSDLADTLHSNADINQQRLNALYVLFSVSAVSLVWSIIAWIVVID